MLPRTTTADEPCPTCGQPIPADRYALHAAGLDGARPECPLQDLVEIAMRARPLWSGNAWTEMRARFQDTRSG